MRFSARTRAAVGPRRRASSWRSCLSMREPPAAPPARVTALATCVRADWFGLGSACAPALGTDRCTRRRELFGPGRAVARSFAADVAAQPGMPHGDAIAAFLTANPTFDLARGNVDQQLAAQAAAGTAADPELRA